MQMPGFWTQAATLALALAGAAGCDDDGGNGGAADAQASADGAPGRAEAGGGDDLGAADARPDMASSDAASPDAASPDAASPDAASPDAASPDAASPDAARSDAASLDAAPADLGASDAGAADLGASDAGADLGRPRDVQDDPLDCTVTWVQRAFDGVTLRERLIDPRCTDAAIDSCPSDGRRCMDSKKHFIAVPEDGRRGRLWVHLVGSGGEPDNASNIVRTAATLGHHGLGLAYMNEPSVDDRCTDPETGEPRPPECEGLVRGEIIDGDDRSPWVAVDRANSIEHRLERVLALLHAEDPARGWDAFLSAQGAIRWDRVAVSGFSQGGGMAGMISRDHAVARAVFFSKGAGATPTLGADCLAGAECPSGRCCPAAEPECEATPPAGGRCIDIAPTPWAETGALGVGTAADRATPGSRLYGIYHRDETAALYSPQVFALWGMGDPAAAVDADQPGPYGDAHVFNSGLAPCGNGSLHQSMGNNAVQPKVGGCGGGVPAMIEAWRHMMSHVDPATP